MRNIPTQGNPDFDWEEYEASCPSIRRKQFNQKVEEKYPGARVYSREPYALELYEKMMGYPVTSKDFEDGDVIKVRDVKVKDSENVRFSLVNGLELDFEMQKERKFCDIYNINPQACEEMTPEWISEFVESDVYVSLSTKGNNIKGNLLKGHEVKVTNDFVKQIKNPTSAYIANVITRNKGGFMVDVMGVTAFLPGGLAAANKIVDFEEYMNKDIPVMIEDYLKDTDTFIVSNKKYIKHILPTKISELDHSAKYTGYVTGTAKYGIFVEFDEIFTGLLHYSKMTMVTRDKFRNREFRPGDELIFWIKEVAKDNRIILSEEDPMERLNQIDEFKSKNLGVVKNGKVVSIKPFGTLVKLENDIIGLVSKKELKAKRKDFEVGDDIMVTVDDVQKDKIYLSLTDETENIH